MSTGTVTRTEESRSSRESTPTQESAPTQASQRVRRDEPASQPPEQENDQVERGQEEEKEKGSPLGGLLDGIRSWAGDQVDAYQDRVQKVDKQHKTEWKNPQDALRNLERNGDLSTYSNAQFLKLDALASVNEKAGKQIRDHVAGFVNRQDSLSGLPESRSFQSLLKHQVVDYKPEGNLLERLFNGPDKVQQAQQHLRDMVESEVRASLDEQLEGREGDSEAEQAMKDWGGDLTSMVERNPALLDMFKTSSDELGKSEDTTSRLEDIAHADDSLFEKATGALGSVAGDVLDNLPAFGMPGSNLPVIGDKMQDLRNEVLSEGGDWLGDRAQDLITWDQNPLGTDGALGGAIELFGGDGEEFEKNLRGGLGNFANQTVDGLTGALADPSGTARGFAEMLGHTPNPARLLLGESFDEQLEKDGEFWGNVVEQAAAGYDKSFDQYGTVGGFAHVLGDVALTVGTGGAEGAVVKGLQASRFTRATRLVEKYQEFSNLSTALPQLRAAGLADGLPTSVVDEAVRWADRYQDMGDINRRVIGKSRSGVSTGAEEAGEEEEQQQASRGGGF